jgi:signal transduction histidine kinase
MVSPCARELVPIVEKLQQTLRSLQQAFEREKQAIADISHDLRTPIAALLTDPGSVFTATSQR